MKIVQAHSLDSIADYAMREVDKPAPGPGQVLVDVVACGVGYVDSLVSLGKYQVKPPLPHIPGMEVGGRIAALGDGVSGIAVGDRVMASVRGGFAQFALTGAAEVWKIPDRMSFAQASGLRINYLTALHGLRDRAAIRPGERLLVLGAAGGVGLAAVQVGRVLGAQVIACASTEDKRAYASAHGAQATIDSNPEGWRDRLKALCDGKGPDVVFDPVCGPLFELAFRSLSWRGRQLVVGFAGGPIPALRANLTLMKGAGLLGVDVRQFLLFEAELARAELTELLGWVGDGRLDPPVGREFAFDDYRDALEYALTGKGLGRTVLRVGDGD